MSAARDLAVFTALGHALSAEDLPELEAWFEIQLRKHNGQVPEPLISKKVEEIQDRKTGLSETLIRKVRARTTSVSYTVDFEPQPVGGERPRESKPSGATRRRGQPKRDDDGASGSDDDPPRHDLGRVEAAGIRLSAHLQRRQGRRFDHIRGSAVA